MTEPKGRCGTVGSADLKNFYSVLPKSTIKRDKNFKNHMIEPNSMVGVIGGTGTGKSNALVNFLSLKNDTFTDILIFSGSTTDEPLYQYLASKIPTLQLYNNIEEVPELNTFEDSKKQEKLIVFDDCINLPKKDFKKINEYFTAGRKFGFTVFILAQNFVSIPKVATRNLQYLILFKIPEAYTINRLLKLYNKWDVPEDQLKEWYLQSTEKKLDFFMLDLKGGKECAVRHNFKDCFPVA